MIRRTGIALLMLLASCSGKHTQKTHQMQFMLTTFRSDGDWAYSIYIDGKEYIRQLYIPALAGEQPFPDEAAARATGRLVMDKLQHRHSPSLTKDELVQLKIIPANALH